MLAKDFIIFLIIFIVTGSIPGHTQDCGIPESTILTFHEPLLPGDELVFFNTTDKVEIASATFGSWRMDNMTLYTANEVNLDDNPALCLKSSIQLRLKCTVSGSSPESSFQQDLFITVLPVNNYPPRFKENNKDVTIQEGLPSGHVVMDVDRDTNVTDLDCRDTITYSGRSSTDALKFVAPYTIETNRTFDYEAGDRDFTMEVTARDTPPAGDTNGPYNATFFLHLHIRDVDDENPAFLNSSYTLHVQEQNTSKAGFWVAAVPPVLAEDQDKGINQPVVYSIAATVPSDPDPDISIHTTDGRLMVNGTLDREAVDKYLITLKAVQTDNHRRSATTTLTLLVDDINDNRPLFDPLTYTIQIQEHTLEGTNVIRVSATDSDEGVNSDFTFELLSETDVFTIDPDTGYIHVKNSTLLDREGSNPQFILNVTARESERVVGNACNASCYATVTVDLIDINDHSPKFEKCSYTFSADNNTVGSLIGQVSATDADEGDNGRMEYSIPVQSDPDNPDFSVNGTTGWITQENSVMGTRQMLIRACDLGEQSRCDSTMVTVTVPKHAVTSTSVTANVTENVPIATPVYIIPDTYSGYQLELNPQSDTFKLSTESSPGIVITDASIDRENISRYTVLVSVKLADTTSATITVNILVLDQNDNPPVFNKSSYDFHIKDDAKTGDVVGNVVAYDLDEGVNSDIIFNIQGTQSSQQFEIGSDTGQIKLLKVPDLTREYTEIVIVATDNGEVPLKASTAVKVYVGWKSGKVRFFAPAGKDDVEKDQDELIRQMSDILKVNVGFDEVRSVNAPYGPSCAIYLTATHRSVRDTTGTGAVTEDDLRSRVEANYEALLSLFSKYDRSTASPNEDPITLPVIVLIAICSAILLASVVVIAILCRSKNRYRRKARLASNLSRQGTIYDTQQVKVDLEDDASVHSLTGSLTTQQLLGESQPNGNVIGAINPGYNGSNSSHGDENQDTVTQCTHVEDYQEVGDVTEEVIVDLSPEKAPEQETGETNPDPDYHTPSVEETSSTNPGYVNTEITQNTTPDPDYVNANVVQAQTDPLTNDTANVTNDPIYAVVNKNKPEVVTEDNQETEEPPDLDPEDVQVNNVVEEGGGEEEEEEEEDFPPPPPTPPRVRKKDAADEEEEVEESPDEPEPDYAKKVRFSEVKVQVIPEPEEAAAGTVAEAEAEAGGAETDDEDPTVKTDRPFETIQNPADDISDDGTFVMTQL